LHVGSTAQLAASGCVDVRTVGITWNRSRRLGLLAGAHAGVTGDRELRRTARVMAEVLGSSPRTGTVFVSFADGTRHETALRLGTDEQRQAIDAAVTRFNAMADAAAKAGDHKTSENKASEKQGYHAARRASARSSARSHR